MPHEQLSDKQVAAYLHMDLREVLKLASRGRIPCRKVQGRFVFHKSDVDHWVTAQLGDLGKDRLAKIERGVIDHHGFAKQDMLVGEMIPPDGIAVPLLAKTRDAVIRALIDLAERADLVYVRDEMLQEILHREELCSTALAPGVALPHPRHPLPYDIARSFAVVGLTSSGVPYGAADGSLTRLFFLICCKDDRTHLHVLARLGRMLADQSAIDTLIASQSPDELRETLVRIERAVPHHEDG